MKPRYKITGKEDLCMDYPDCECIGHLVYKKNLKKIKGGKK